MLEIVGFRALPPGEKAAGLPSCRAGIDLIGALSHLIPLTSTLVLVAPGGHPFSLVPVVAMVLIVSGTVIGSLDLFGAVPIRVTSLH